MGLEGVEKLGIADSFAFGIFLFLLKTGSKWSSENANNVVILNL